MSRMKTLLSAAILSLFSASLAMADLSLAQVFASCAGRYSAEMQHAWLFGATKASEYAERRDVFVSLAEASASDTEGSKLLNDRIEAKYAHAQLLTVAAFQNDRRRANAAMRLAADHIGACQQLLLRG